MQGDTARSMAAALGRPGRAACVNIFLPCEVLHALNIPPVLPEGLSCYLVSTAAERVFVEAAEERGVPESYCSYHKILLGLAETGVMARPRFILNTSLACDANQLTFRRLAEFWDVPRFTVDVPYAPSEESVAQVAEQLRAMAAFVQAHGGRPLEEDALRAAVARSRATVEGYRRYLALRAERSLSDEMTSEMLSVFATHSMLGSPEALRLSLIHIYRSPKPGTPSTPSTRALTRLTPRWRPTRPPTPLNAHRAARPTPVRAASRTNHSSGRRRAANSKIRINPPTIQGRALSKVSTAIPSQLSSASPLAAGSPRSYPGCACASPSSSLTRRSR